MANILKGVHLVCKNDARKRDCSKLEVKSVLLLGAFSVTTDENLFELCTFYARCKEAKKFQSRVRLESSSLLVADRNSRDAHFHSQNQATIHQSRIHLYARPFSDDDRCHDFKVVHFP
jgi:hypothetical protein